MTNTYRDKPCAYCGAVTGRNQGEHVLPRSFYPSTVPQIQRAMVPSCNACNQWFSKHESHFRAVLAIAGLSVTAEREELFGTAMRSFDRPKGGRTDFERLFRTLVPAVYEGQPTHRVYPARDEGVMRIVRKVIRGLSVYADLTTTPIADDRVWATVNTFVTPASLEAELKTVYEVPNLALCRACPCDMPDELEAIWHLKLLQVEFVGVVFAAGSSMNRYTREAAERNDEPLP